MRLRSIALSITLLSGISGPAASQTAAKREIATLEEDWIKAVIRRDAGAFNRLLAPEFVYTEDDRVYDKDQLIREVTRGADTVTSGRNEDLVVRVYGNTAIATGWLVLIGHSNGRHFERRYRYTDTWVRTAGRWRVIAAQDYLKP